MFSSVIMEGQERSSREAIVEATSSVNATSTNNIDGGDPEMALFYPGKEELVGELKKKRLARLLLEEDEGENSPTIPSSPLRERLLDVRELQRQRRNQEQQQQGLLLDDDDADTDGDECKVNSSTSSSSRSCCESPGNNQSCAICLEKLSAAADESATVPCACQEKLDAPTTMHVVCLRAWVSACSKRSPPNNNTNNNSPGTSPEGSGGPTCPLCRAPFSDDAVYNLMIAPRPRTQLAYRAREFACEPLLPSDETLRCVVRVLDRSHRKRWPLLSTSDAQPLLALSVEGLAGRRSSNGDPREAPPLLLARAPRRLGTSRLATKFEIVSLDSHPVSGDVDFAKINGTVVARLARNWKGTRWTVQDVDTTGSSAANAPATTESPAAASSSSSENNNNPRCIVEYAVNRLANRPRSMFVHLGADTSSSTTSSSRPEEQQPDHSKGELVSRTPEYNAQLQGFCLDFFGRARLASVRNFQIVDNNNSNDSSSEANSQSGGGTLSDEQRCLLLFGRWSPDEFHLDVKAPFSLVDAFAIAVSSYATKLATI